MTAFELTPAMLHGLPRTGPTDPIEYYRRPLVGWLFRERINRGLRMLPARRFSKALEVGYGAGAVQLALAPGVDELHGIDLDADPGPVETVMGQRGRSTTLTKGSVLEMPYEADSFELVVSFSVFEHLDEYRRALEEVHRVLRAGGLFLLGMPAVNKLMEAGFLAIGFKGIDDHHVTTPAAVAARFAEAGFRVVERDQLALPLRPPWGVPLYYVWLLERRAPRAGLI
jgi:SAM-dependent methyltransferase